MSYARKTVPRAPTSALPAGPRTRAVTVGERPSVLTYRERVARRYRFALRPGWLALYVVALAMAVTMVLLGRWQLTVSERKHFSIQNFGYALQWWAFSVFVLGLVYRFVRDARRRMDEAADPTLVQTAPSDDQPVAYRRYTMPAPAPIEDPTLAAYNDYLAQLNAHDQPGPAREHDTEEQP